MAYVQENKKVGGKPTSYWGLIYEKILMILAVSMLLVGCGNTDTQFSTSTECPYELGVWYDMGWYFFKLMPSKVDFAYDAPRIQLIP